MREGRVKIYLVRHAIADDSSNYEVDSLWPLTEKGCEKMKKIADALKGICVKPDLIVSSPYVRESQTASILAKTLKHKEKMTNSDSIVPMREADDMIEEINEKYSVNELMLVGYEPSLSTLVSVLLGGTPELSINLKKGGVCCLSVDDLHYDRKAVLEWLITPEISTK